MLTPVHLTQMWKKFIDHKVLDLGLAMMRKIFFV